MSKRTQGKKAFAIGVALVGLAVTAAIFASNPRMFLTRDAVLWFILLLAPAILTTQQKHGGPSVTASQAPALASLLVVGLPLTACLIAFQAVVYSIRNRARWNSPQSPTAAPATARFGETTPRHAVPNVKPRTRFLGRWSVFFNVGQRILAVVGAGMVLRLSEQSAVNVGSFAHVMSSLTSLGLATFTFYALNTGLIAVPLSVDVRTPIRTTWWRSFRWSLPQLFWIPLGAFVLASLYDRGLWFPFAIVYASELCATRLGAAIMRLRTLLAQTIEVLRTILVKTAPHLENETERIRDLALKLAAALRLNPFERAAMEKAIPLLNMGYVGVEKHLLLRKPDWEEDEREQMLRHPLRGARILSKTHHLKEAARLVALHHERMDGSGYPQGIEGPDIPLGARILGTVEAYVGMTSRRPHRSPLSPEQAIAELSSEQYDPRVVAHLAWIEGIDIPTQALSNKRISIHNGTSGWAERLRQIRDFLYYPRPPDSEKSAPFPVWFARAFFLPAPLLFIALYVTSAETLTEIGYNGALWLGVILGSAMLAPIFLRRGATLSAVMGSLVAAILLIPPAQALAYCLVAGTILGAWEFARRRLPTSGPSLSAGTITAVAVYHLLRSHPGSVVLFESAAGPVYLVPAIATALAFGVGSTGTASILEGAVQRLSPYRVMMGSHLPFLPETLLYLFGGIVMAAMYSLFGPAGAALALVYPLLDLHFDIWHQNQLQRSYTELLEAEAAAIDEKDSYTRGHSQRVSSYAVAVAREMGLSESDVNLVEEGGFEHDIGKIAWEDGMLMQPYSLTGEEYELMLKHPADGAEIAAKMGAPETVIEMIYHHHEHFDGRGFPGHLAGERIPLAARILHVVDAFDAMTSGRPYTKNKTPEEALQELRRCAGSDFDPDVVGAFEQAFEKAKIEPPAPSAVEKDRVPEDVEEPAPVPG